MPGLVPGIHAFGCRLRGSPWMAGTSPATTTLSVASILSVATRRPDLVLAEDLLCGAKMRLVDHLAVEPQRAGIRIARERRNHLLRPIAFGLGRLERGVDHIDMFWMDQRLRRKSVAPRGARFLLEARQIVDVGVDGVDRRDFGRGRRHQAEIAREAIRAMEYAAGGFLGGAERG